MLCISGVLTALWRRLWYIVAIWRHGASLVAHAVFGGPKKLRVTKMCGTLICEGGLGRARYVRDVKDSIERAVAVLRREQRLLLGTRELTDDESLGTLATDEITEFTLVRRPPEQAEWLEMVSTHPLQLQEAPEIIRADQEIVLAAAKVDARALDHAAASLWKNRGFLVLAVEHNWLVWLRPGIPEELRNDRDVTIAILARHARALKHVSKPLLSDRDVVLAAICQVPHSDYVNGALETLMAEHAKFVFELASPRFRGDRDFMIAAAQKDWHTCEYAATELWHDREFVLSAVKRSGLLLEKASDALKADREVVMVAVAQTGNALLHAAPELLNDRELAVWAVSQSWRLLEYVGEDLRKDPMVVVCSWFQRFSSALLWCEHQAGRWLGHPFDMQATSVNWPLYALLLLLVCHAVVLFNLTSPDRSPVPNPLAKSETSCPASATVPFAAMATP